MTQRKPTSIAKAVEEIKKRKVNAPTISARIWNDALNEAIEVVEELKEYERGCIEELLAGVEYFDLIYTQEGGQS